MTDAAAIPVTDGRLLGGRVSYRQPGIGYRTGIEPVLLAASVAAIPGERVLEGGTGAGAALLCLSARLPGVAVTGLELDPTLADLARSNLAANGFRGAGVETTDITGFTATEPFDHAIANPPWHDAVGPASPDRMRDAAKRAAPGLLAIWSRRLARAVRPGGSVTILVPARVLAEAIDALGAASCGDITLLPLWPRAGQEARLLLLRATKAGRGPCRVLPGLVLHGEDGFSPDARAILWDGAALDWR